MPEDITVRWAGSAVRSVVEHAEPSKQAVAWIRSARACWRELTGGPGVPDSLRSTLVAVSGGSDSAALAIALATLDEPRVVLAHVLHDQRPAELVHDDRAAVARLGKMLGVRCGVTHARALEGNAEHAARRARYEALDRIATAHGCRSIATAHHAHDQAETLLMAMCRGGSPESLLGIHRVRESITPGTSIVRPALELLPQCAVEVCREFGYVPRTDATNRDCARARARLRSHVVPALAADSPRLGVMLARTVARLGRRLETGGDSSIYSQSLEQ